jgi:uncharacterized protein
MPSHNFGSFVFTPVVKALQERYGSRRQYAKLEKAAGSPDGLGEDKRLFIAERDSLFMASVGATGWPYIQHRGGPKGFLKVIDDRTIAFADFSGNKQFISAGNLTTDARVALILVDYPQQARLKILGRAEILEGDHATGWIERIRDPRYKGRSSGCSSFIWTHSTGTARSTSRRVTRRRTFRRRSRRSSRSCSDCSRKTSGFGNSWRIGKDA